jgi:membrane-associated phospholipid phosphatase
MFILVFVSIQWWDLPLADWIADNLHMRGLEIRRLNVPDLLFMFASALTIASWLAYLWLSRSGVPEKYLIACRLTGTTLPAAVAVKSVLKWIFGRTETRAWLADPDSYGFHWLAGNNGFNGFPSGHMLVLTPLFLILWNYYPRYRLYYGVMWIGLAIALLMTEYHFLSDVMAGGYAGAIVYFAIDRWLGSSAGNSAQNGHAMRECMASASQTEN